MQVRDLRKYAQNNLLKHLIASGMSLDDIESLIRRMPDDEPDREHFADQYVLLLPEEKRFETSISLLPNQSSLVKIFILTVEGQPVFKFPTNVSVERIDKLIETNFGLYKGIKKHTWMRIDL